MKAIVKPWPFKGWSMELIEKILPLSSKGHSYILVATDYFIKWAKSIPLKSVDQQDAIKAIKECIIHIFDLPQTIVAERCTVFFGDQVWAFAHEYGFEFTHSTHYYAQGNGKAESTNKILE